MAQLTKPESIGDYVNLGSLGCSWLLWFISWVLIFYGGCGLYTQDQADFVYEQTILGDTGCLLNQQGLCEFVSCSSQVDFYNDHCVVVAGSSFPCPLSDDLADMALHKCRAGKGGGIYLFALTGVFFLVAHVLVNVSVFTGTKGFTMSAIVWWTVGFAFLMISTFAMMGYNGIIASYVDCSGMSKVEMQNVQATGLTCGSGRTPWTDADGNVEGPDPIFQLPKATGGDLDSISGIRTHVHSYYGGVSLGFFTYLMYFGILIRTYSNAHGAADGHDDDAKRSLLGNDRNAREKDPEAGSNYSNIDDSSGPPPADS